MEGQAEHVITAQAPVNIAVIKYWGKSNIELKIPINDSLSGTLDLNYMCTTTSIYISETYEEDRLVLNNKEQSLSNESCAGIMLNELRRLSPFKDSRASSRVHIISKNNFPTAAGLASSAAGYACLAYALGHAFGVTDEVLLSTIARKGSGSACRSLFGGFVHWQRGNNHETSISRQVVDQHYWPNMRVVICVVNDAQKDVPSSAGMSRSVQTSSLMEHRAEIVVPQRIEAMKQAILNKDFQTFATLTMQDSNQFHAICLDTFPPIFYLNETSRLIIRICSLVNDHYGHNKVAYTFDAGPNACIYLLEDFVDEFIGIIQSLFPQSDGSGLEVRGRGCKQPEKNSSVLDYLKTNQIQPKAGGISYLINTAIGGGPRLIDEHIDHD